MSLTARPIVLALAVLCFLVAAAWSRREAAAPAAGPAALAGYVGAALLSVSFLLPG